MRVVWGRCWEAGGAPAFWPWTQVTRTLGVSDAAPELGTSASPADAEQARFKVFDAVAGLLAREAATTPLVIILDDAHVADMPSLLLLQFVARGLRSSKIMLVVTHREIEARIRPEIGDLLGKIARDGETFALRRLEETDVATWLRAAGHPDSAAAKVHRATEGNPLFVQELLEMPQDGAWNVSSSDAVRVAIGEHLGRLSSAARGVLEVASVLGREASHADLARLAELSAGVDAELREATALGVVEPRGGDRVAFRHILLRDELYNALPPKRRGELHARAAELLARRAALGDPDALAQAAHHGVHAARDGGDVDLAVLRVRAAAQRAVERVAFEQAAELLEAVVSLLESRGAMDTPTAAAVLVELGEALLLSGLSPRGREVCAQAAALAKALGDKPLMVRAALVYGSELVTGRRDERMVTLLRDALDAVGPEDSPTRARLMARLSSAVIPVPVGEAFSTQLARDAIAMARRSGDRLTMLHTLQFASGGIAFRVGAEERGVLVRETVTLAMELDRPVIAAMSLPWAIGSAIELGDLAECDRLIGELGRLVARMPQANYRVRLPLAIALRASLAGAWEEADQALAEARLLADSAETPLPRFLLAFGYLALHMARRDGTRMNAHAELMDSVFNAFPGGRAFGACFTALRASCGLIDKAEARISVGRAVREFMGFLRVFALPASGVAAYAATLVGDCEIVRDLYDFVAGEGGAVSPIIHLAGGAGTLGPTSLLLGDMDALLGRKDDARRNYDQAIAFSESIRAVPFAERARARRAELDVGTSPPPSRARLAPAAAPPEIALMQEGEMWTLRAGDEQWHLKPSKGFSYLATLLAHPHQEIHVAQLAGAGDAATGDAGPRLDAAAKDSYRQRATELRATLDLATRDNDIGRAEKARAEMEALGDELARAVGLGGRDRKAASDVERMRVNVQRRIRDAIERVRTQSPALGRYLDASVRTGSFCSYAPAWTGKDG